MTFKNKNCNSRAFDFLAFDLLHLFNNPYIQYYRKSHLLLIMDILSRTRITSENITDEEVLDATATRVGLKTDEEFADRTAILTKYQPLFQHPLPFSQNVSCMILSNGSCKRDKVILSFFLSFFDKNSLLFLFPLFRNFTKKNYFERFCFSHQTKLDIGSSLLNLIILCFLFLAVFF